MRLLLLVMIESCLSDSFSAIASRVSRLLYQDALRVMPLVTRGNVNCGKEMLFFMQMFFFLKIDFIHHDSSLRF